MVVTALHVDAPWFKGLLSVLRAGLNARVQSLPHEKGLTIPRSVRAVRSGEKTETPPFRFTQGVIFGTGRGSRRVPGVRKRHGNRSDNTGPGLGSHPIRRKRGDQPRCNGSSSSRSSFPFRSFSSIPDRVFGEQVITQSVVRASAAFFQSNTDANALLVQEDRIKVRICSHSCEIIRHLSA